MLIYDKYSLTVQCLVGPGTLIGGATVPHFEFNLKWRDLFPFINKHGKLPLVIVALNIAWTDCGARNCSIQVPAFLINNVLLGLTWLAQPLSCHPRGKQWVCIFFINNWNGPVDRPANDCHQKTFLANRSATWIKLWIYVRHVLPLTGM